MKNLTPLKISKTLALTGFLASLALIANPAQASTIALQGFTGGSRFPAVNGTNQTIGWSFTANDNLIVSSLGFWDFTPTNPLGQSHRKTG